MRTGIAAAVLFCLANLPWLYATAQMPDKITINNHSYNLYTNPLEAYFASNPQKRPESDVVSSACWRGYVASWEIVDDELVLRKVEVSVTDPKAKGDEFKTIMEDRIGDIFPGVLKVVAIWYSGTLTIPEGDLVEYVHMGYASTYERYIMVAIEKGRVIKQLNFSMKEFEEYRLSQFNAFKKTPEYEKAFEEAKKDLTPEQAEKFLFQFESERYMSLDLSKESR